MLSLIIRRLYREARVLLYVTTAPRWNDETVAAIRAGSR